MVFRTLTNSPKSLVIIVEEIFCRDLSNLRRTISQRRKFKSQFSFVGSKSSIVANDDYGDEEHIGDQYLYWVGFACAFMFIIKWWWTPYLIGIHLFACLGKRLCKFVANVFVYFEHLVFLRFIMDIFILFLVIAVGVHGFICDSWNSFTSKLSVTNDERLVILFPAPIINLYEVSMN